MPQPTRNLRIQDQRLRLAWFTFRDHALPAGCRGWFGERLHALPVDERSVPELEVEEAPDAIAAIGGAGRMLAEQRLDGAWIGEAPFTGAPVEQDLGRDRVPCAAGPAGERHRKTHLRTPQNAVGQDALHRLAQDALGREAGQLPLVR